VARSSGCRQPTCYTLRSSSGRIVLPCRQVLDLGLAVMAADGAPNPSDFRGPIPNSSVRGSSVLRRPAGSSGMADYGEPAVKSQCVAGARNVRERYAGSAATSSLTFAAPTSTPLGQPPHVMSSACGAPRRIRKRVCDAAKWRVRGDAASALDESLFAELIEVGVPGSVTPSL